MYSGNNRVYKVKSLPFNRKRLVKHLKELLDVEKVEEDVDILIYLDFMMFLERLAKKAEAEGQDNCVRQKNIENNLESVLREFRG